MLAVRGGDDDLLSVESRRAPDDRHVVALEQCANTAGELLDDLLASADDGLIVEAHVLRLDAKITRVLHGCE